MVEVCLDEMVPGAINIFLVTFETLKVVKTNQQIQIQHWRSDEKELLENAKGHALVKQLARECGETDKKQIIHGFLFQWGAEQTCIMGRFHPDRIKLPRYQGKTLLDQAKAMANLSVKAFANDFMAGAWQMVGTYEAKIKDLILVRAGNFHGTFDQICDMHKQLPLHKDLGSPERLVTNIQKHCSEIRDLEFFVLVDKTKTDTKTSDNPLVSKMNSVLGHVRGFLCFNVDDQHTARVLYWFIHPDVDDDAHRKLFVAQFAQYRSDYRIKKVVMVEHKKNQMYQPYITFAESTAGMLTKEDTKAQEQKAF